VEDSIQGLLLIGGGDDARDQLTVTTQGIAIVEASDLLAGRFCLVAMQQIEWHKRVFKLRHGHAWLNGVFAKTLQGCRADGEDAVQLIGWIWAVPSGRESSSVIKSCPLLVALRRIASRALCSSVSWGNSE